ncbi:MAG: hypothetical protein ACKO2K_18370 [Alphaproteobacteria bacterium]
MRRWFALRDCGERGGALVAAITILALLLATTGATLVMTRSHLWAAGRARSAWQARASAEAGARHAAALLAPGTSFEPVVSGKGGLSRPASPGPLPATGRWSWFPGPPWGYGVVPSLLPAAPFAGSRLALDVDATGPRGTHRHLRATVGRVRAAWAPAVLVVASGEARLEPGASLVVDASGAASGTLAALAAGSREASATLLATMRSAGARLAGGVETAVTDPVDVAAWVATSSVKEVAPDALAADFAATSGAIARTTRGGTAPSLEGRGVVASSGDLEIRGRVGFTGVLLVAGELRLDSPDCRVAGLVFARALRSAGCELRADPVAIAAADAVVRLPRDAVLLGLSED